MTNDQFVTSHELRRSVLTLLLAILVALFVSVEPDRRATGAPQAASAQRLEIGRFTEAVPPVPERWRVVSYNIHHPNRKRLDEIIGAFHQHERLRGAHLIALQETDRGREKGSRHDARAIARALGMYYVFAAHFPPTPERPRDHGVALLSAFPLSEPERVELPPANMGTRARIALAATVQLGRERIRVYTLHIQREVSVERRREQIETVVTAGDQRGEKKTLILGDLNTVGGAAKRAILGALRDAGFSTPLPGDQYTFKRALVLRFALDWIFLRNLEAVDSGVVTELTLSDHRPIWADIAVVGQ